MHVSRRRCPTPAALSSALCGIHQPFNVFTDLSFQGRNVIARHQAVRFAYCPGQTEIRPYSSPTSRLVHTRNSWGSDRWTRWRGRFCSRPPTFRRRPVGVCRRCFPLLSWLLHDSAVLSFDFLLVHVRLFACALQRSLLFLDHCFSRPRLSCPRTFRGCQSIIITVRRLP